MTMECDSCCCVLKDPSGTKAESYIRSRGKKLTIPLPPNAPQFFWDVDNEAKQLLASYFHPGVMHLNVHTQALNGVQLDISGHHYTESKNTTCSIQQTQETRFGEISARVLSSNQLQVQTSFLGTFFPNLAQTVTAKINYCALETSHVGMDNCFRNDNMAICLGMKFKEKLPRLTFSGVFGSRGYFAGFQSSVSTHKQQFTALDGVVGYRHSDNFAFAGRLCNWGTCYQATVWQNLSQRFQYAASLQWRQIAASALEENAPGQGTVGYAVCGKWNLSRPVAPVAPGQLRSEGTFLKVQYSNQQVNPLSMALSFPLLDNARLTMSTDFSLRGGLRGGKLGISLEIEG